MGRRLRLAALVAAAALIGAACGGDNGGGDGGNGATGGGEITIALGSEPTTLDPQIRDDGGERAVNDNVYETLMTRTETGDLVPGLAGGEPTQVDETTWEFTLQEGIEFHNGEPFNADAVVASVERVIDPALESEQLSFFETISGAEAVDDTTVQIQTSVPDPVLPSRMYWMKMIPPDASQEEDFADNPVGTGPYSFVEWVKGDHITLEKNPDYWDEEPSVDTVTYSFIAEPGTRLSGLLAGEYDLITNLPPEDTEAAPQFANVQGLEHPVIILNVDEGPTADPRVRQALNLAVDKDAIAEELYGGFAVVDDCQILSPTWFGYNDGLEPYPYDPEQAQQLLSDAGAEGLSVELIGTAGRWLKDRELIEAVANYWNEIGVNAKVQIFEFDEYLNRLFGEVRPNSVFVVSSNELLDADRNLSAYYHPEGTGASNSSREMAQLLEQARSETDVAAREDLYAQATELACNDAWFTFLVNIEDIYGMSERLTFEPRVDAKLLVKEMSVSS